MARTVVGRRASARADVTGLIAVLMLDQCNGDGYFADFSERQKELDSWHNHTVILSASEMEPASHPAQWIEVYRNSLIKYKVKNWNGDCPRYVFKRTDAAGNHTWSYLYPHAKGRHMSSSGMSGNVFCKVTGTGHLKVGYGRFSYAELKRYWELYTSLGERFLQPKGLNVELNFSTWEKQVRASYPPASLRGNLAKAAGDHSKEQKALADIARHQLVWRTAIKHRLLGMIRPVCTQGNESDMSGAAFAKLSREAQLEVAELVIQRLEEINRRSMWFLNDTKYEYDGIVRLLTESSAHELPLWVKMPPVCGNVRTMFDNGTSRLGTEAIRRVLIAMLDAELIIHKATGHYLGNVALTDFIVDAHGVIKPFKIQLIKRGGTTTYPLSHTHPTLRPTVTNEWLRESYAIGVSLLTMLTYFNPDTERYAEAEEMAFKLVQGAFADLNACIEHSFIGGMITFLTEAKNDPQLGRDPPP